jgi:hypothetical protein
MVKLGSSDFAAAAAAAAAATLSSSTFDILPQNCTNLLHNIIILSAISGH